MQQCMMLFYVHIGHYQHYLIILLLIRGVFIAG